MEVFTEKSHLSTMMNEMYKFVKEKSLCDLTMTIDDKSFHLHKCVFAAACPLLRYLIDKALEISDGTELKLKLHGIELMGFESLVDFVYTGRFPKEDAPAVVQKEFAAACESLSIPYPSKDGNTVIMKHPNHDVRVTLMPRNENGVIEVVLQNQQTNSNMSPSQKQQQQQVIFDNAEANHQILGETVADNDVQTQNKVTDEMTLPEDGTAFDLHGGVVVTVEDTSHSASNDHAYAHHDGRVLKIFSCNNCGAPLHEQPDEKLNKAGKLKYNCQQCDKTFITIKIHKTTSTASTPVSTKRPRQSMSSADVNSLEVEEFQQVGPSAKKMSFYSADGIIRPFVCQLCGTCFTRNHSLKVHLETVCMSRAPVKCLGCHKVLASKQSYNGHVRKYHPNEKPGWVASEWNSMIRIPGQRKKKLEGRTYQCQNCAAIYMSHHHFVTHRKKCTEVTALKCPYCTKLFHIRKEWEKHVWQHQNSDETLSNSGNEEQAEEYIDLEGL